jgi:hypothetical protein
LEGSERYATISFQCSPKGVVKTPTLITGKDEIKQEIMSAAMLASQLGMDFPQMGLPIVIDNGG